MSSPLLLANESGRKRASVPAYESSVNKKPMNYSVAHRSSATPKKLVINLSSLNEKKQAAELEPMKSATPKKAKYIAENIV